MAKLIHKRLAASTLLEVLIAMVIIMVVFTIANKVFNNVISSGASLRKVSVHHQLSRLAEEAKQSGKIEENGLSIDSVTYTYELSNGSLANVSQLEIKATEGERSLGSIKCLIKSNTNDEN